MAKRLPRPFKFRGGWRAQVTLKNGNRPYKDFDSHADAAQWIVDTLANADTEHLPELGGPKQAIVAQALRHYAGLNSITKGGVKAELNRIGHYLAGAGMPLLRLGKDDKGNLVLEEYEPKPQPKGWQEHNDRRRDKRTETYELIHELARKKCSAVSTADIRRLMATMKKEGLSDSTIQKDIALLRHMFNVAAKEWQWKGFDNPTAGIKLGKSSSRFVFITEEQERALWAALAECDNPYIWPLVVCALETTMRKGSLLAMRWEKTDLRGRIAHVSTKTGDVTLPLSKHIVSVLSAMDRQDTGPVFPMSANALDMAWDGVRIKAKLPTLQFRDTRHLGATELARRGHSASELQAILGHKTRYMADVYVNLGARDILRAMDAKAVDVPVFQIPPPASGSAADVLKEKRSARMVKAVEARLRAKQGCTETACDDVAAVAVVAPNPEAPQVPEVALRQATQAPQRTPNLGEGAASVTPPSQAAVQAETANSQSSPSTVEAQLTDEQMPSAPTGVVIAFRPRQRAA